MELQRSELYKTRQIALVDKAYYSNNFKTVIIELRLDSLTKPDQQKTLYFEYLGFRAAKVEECIAKLLSV